MFVSPAYAQAAASAGGLAGGVEAFLPLILIFVVFYFLMIRPQQKRMKAHKEMLGTLRRGDRVVLGGGIMGQVAKVTSETEVQVEIAEGVKVRVVRSAIQEVVSKTEPVAAKDESKDDSEASAEK
ncbi:preprotein translocase subunit YajC [Magnetospirillum sp. 64-120]|uniref:preprotein translocase subunit YajC n=1 Tax=Magnetospirillum sp. 64-120 TaxID=1895778 RepID=UPI000929BC57|nr:preprotein translocase subunit YajC [Magnetospirillum sp. 64-120]OJX81101.1 MAG: preprotein translocase subunit YajC [Magnetospirillum sp. 64-120]